MIQKALSYNDVILIPQYSEVPSRESPSLNVELAGYRLETPIISSNMDTVTEDEMAIAMWKSGGIGALHRFMTIEENVKMYERIRSKGKDCFVSVGTNDYEERTRALFDVGARRVIIDVAHGHTSMMKAAIEGLRKALGSSIYIMAGNVATGQGASDLAKWGANGVKVGIGGGGACKTRLVTGHGMPMFSSILECSAAIDNGDYVADIIADGGIRTSGDIVKALAAGADVVMVGSLLASSNEAPGERDTALGLKTYRGMSSHAAQANRAGPLPAEEGVSVQIPMTGPVSWTLNELTRGTKSGLSYSGAFNIKELRSKAVWREQTDAGFFEGTPHTRGT